MHRSLGLLSKTVLILFSFGLTLTKSTDADFIDKKTVINNKMSATTLNFVNTDTATNVPITNLFNINGIIPGGFQVNAVRLKNEGQSNLYNKITTEMVGGDTNFCQSLDIELNYGDQSTFKGKLVNLSNEAPVLNPNTQSDCVIFIRFNKNDLSLQNKSCQFNFVFNGYNKTASQLSGLKYKKVISSNVTSGNW